MFTQVSCKTSKVLVNSNVKKNGAYGDGIHDDTRAIQLSLNNGGDVYFPKGIYLVRPLKYYSNTRIHGEGDLSELKLLFDTPPKTTDLQSVLYAGNIDIGPTHNVTIANIKINGNRDDIDWSNVRGDGNGNGISTWGTSELDIHNVTVVDCWTDGLFLCATRRAKRKSNTKNFSIENIVIENCGRQGVSVISAENGKFDSIRISNINRTAPRAGFDFEPNTLQDRINTINITNVNIKNCGQGIIIAGVSVPRDLMLSNIQISNIQNQYSIGITNAEDISFEKVSVNNSNGRSKYSTLFVGSARNISFNDLKLLNNKGVTAVEIAPYTNKMETTVTFSNFLVEGFNHSAILVKDEIGRAEFLNGEVRKVAKGKSPYAVVELNSKNVTIQNVNFSAKNNSAYINARKKIKLKMNSYEKGMKTRKN